MGKSYSNGIRTATGLKVDEPTPIDDRFVVDFENDLDFLENSYPGLVVFVKDQNCNYIFNDDGWKKATSKVKSMTFLDNNETIRDTVVNGPAFKIRDNEIVVIESYTMNGQTATKKRVYVLVGVGVGIYGNGIQNLDKKNFLQISEASYDASQAENEENTQKFYIEDLGGSTLADYINYNGEYYDIQSQLIGLRIFIVGTETKLTYVFTGPAGEYGDGFGQVSDDDFEPLRQKSPPNFENIQQFENNSAAIDGGLVDGDVYSLPLIDDISHLAVVKMPDYNFDVTANWAYYGVVDGNSFASFFNVNLEAFSLKGNRLRAVCWGNSDVYLIGVGVTEIRLLPDDVTQLFINENVGMEELSIEHLTSLEWLECIASNFQRILIPPSVKRIYCYENSMNVAALDILAGQFLQGDLPKDYWDSRNQTTAAKPSVALQNQILANVVDFAALF